MMKRHHILPMALGLLPTVFCAVPATAKQETIIAEGQESVLYDTETGNSVFTYLDTSPPGGWGKRRRFINQPMCRGPKSIP